MGGMKIPGPGRLVSVLAAAALVATGCGGNAGNGDKAGGAGEPVVLRMASTGSTNIYRPPIEYFVKRVSDLSKGDLRIEMDFNWGDFAADAEQQAVRDVVAGKVDLTSVGTRVFDTLGIDSFRAIQAPMLIDSYALQGAVVKSGIPARMLAGLDKHGASGLAMVGGAMWKPLAAKKPLLRPADWRGITFQAYRSNDLQAAIKALGAIPTDTLGGLDAGLDDGSIQAFSKGLRGYRINESEQRAPYVAANVNLWADMAVILANPARLARLTDAERGWLTEAAKDAQAASASSGNDENEIVTAICGAGSHLANASDADLAAMRAALAPVYTEMERDPQTKGFIEQIQALRQSTTPESPLAIPSGCGGAAPAPSATSTVDPLAGTWKTRALTEPEVVRAYVAAGGEEKDGHAVFGAQHSLVVTLVFKGGTFQEYQSRDGGVPELGNSGTYTIENGRFVLQTGCTETFGYAITGDVLQLTYVNMTGCPNDGHPIGKTLYTSFPLTRST